MPEYTFEEIIEMWKNDDEIKKFHIQQAKEDIKWALECHEKLINCKKIPLSDLKNGSICGENTEYASRGLVFFYNSTDVLLGWEIIFDNSSVFKVVYKHVETPVLSNGWYEELNYAKFLPQPYYDPMDLFMLSSAFRMIYKPKYGKTNNHSL